MHKLPQGRPQSLARKPELAEQDGPNMLVKRASHIFHVPQVARWDHDNVLHGDHLVRIYVTVSSRSALEADLFVCRS